MPKKAMPKGMRKGVRKGMRKGLRKGMRKRMRKGMRTHNDNERLAARAGARWMVCSSAARRSACRSARHLATRSAH